MTDSPPDPEEPIAPRGERPTLKTISRMTGLAVATVSRALHDAPDIGRDTKRRVQKVADQIGYRPNRAGVRLRTGKTNVISLVLSTDHDMMNHTARLISALAGELRNSPYHMIVTPYFPTEDPMAPVRYIVETGSADAVILNQTEPEDPRIAYLMARGFPFATHGRTNWCADHAYYDFDNRRFAEIAVAELARRGRKSVLLVAPPQSQNYARNMIDGASGRAAELGVAFAVLQGATSDSESATLEAAFARHLGAHPSTDAVIAGSPTAAMAVVAKAEDMGQVIGAGLDVISKEAIPFLQRFRRAILSVHEDVAAAGSFLARAAIQRIEDPAGPPMQTLDQPKL